MLQFTPLSSTTLPRPRSRARRRPSRSTPPAHARSPSCCTRRRHDGGGVAVAGHGLAAREGGDRARGDGGLLEVGVWPERPTQRKVGAGSAPKKPRRGAGVSSPPAASRLRRDHLVLAAPQRERGHAHRAGIHDRVGDVVAAAEEPRRLVVGPAVARDVEPAAAPRRRRGGCACFSKYACRGDRSRTPSAPMTFSISSRPPGSGTTGGAGVCIPGSRKASARDRFRPRRPQVDRHRRAERATRRRRWRAARPAPHLVWRRTRGAERASHRRPPTSSFAVSVKLPARDARRVRLEALRRQRRRRRSLEARRAKAAKP